MCIPALLPAQDWSWVSPAYSADSELYRDVFVNDSLNEIWVVAEFDDLLTSLPTPPSPLISGTPNGLIVKLDTAGSLLDYVTLSSNSPIDLRGVVQDDSGNVYVTGSIEGTADFSGNLPANTLVLNGTGTQKDAFAAKFNRNLEGVWVVAASGIDEQLGLDLAVNGTELVVTGEFETQISAGGTPALPSVGGEDVFVWVVDKGTGTHNWLINLGGTADESPEGIAIGDGDIYLTGSFTSASLFYASNPGGAISNASTNSDVFITRIDTTLRDGLWLSRAGGVLEDIGHGLCWTSGQLLIGGEYRGTSSFQGGGASISSAGGSDGFTAGVDLSNGDFNWVRPVGGVGEEAVWDVAIDNSGNVIATGEFSDFVLVTAGVSLSPAGVSDLFVTGYSSAGAPLTWARSAGNNHTVHAEAIFASGSGIYVAGRYDVSQGTFFSPMPLSVPAAGEENAFVARLGCEIIPSPILNASIADDSLCLGESVSITVPSSMASNGYQLVEIGGDSLGPVVSGTNGVLVLPTVPLDSSMTIGIVVWPGGTACEVFAEDTFVVFVQPPFVPDLGADTTACQDSIVLEVPLAYAAYLWSSTAATPTEWVSSSGLYWLEVTDGSGCSGRDSIDVTLMPPAVVDLGMDTTICGEDSLLLDVGASWTSITWSTGESTSAIFADSTGDFAVEVVDGNGCTGRDTLALVTVETGTVLTTDTSYCTGDSVEVTVWPAGAAYAWSSGDTTQSAVFSAVGMYEVTVTFAGLCNEVDSVNVTELVRPQPDLGNDTVVCSPGSLLLDATMPNVTSYAWTPAGGLSTLNVANDGLYSVEVTGTNGCLGTDTINVDFEHLLITTPPDTFFCAGDSVLLDAGNSGANFNWSTGDTSQTLMVIAGGSYFVTVSQGGCQDSAGISVMEMAVSGLSLGNDTVLCNGAALVLDASIPNGASYAWSTLDTTATLSVALAGNYWVDVMDSNGCAAADTILVGVETIVLGLPNDTAFCAGDSLVLDAGISGASYNWSTGPGTQTILVQSGGFYSVTVTGSQCADSTGVNVSEETLPVVALGADTAFCQSNSWTLDAGNPGAMFTWSTSENSQQVQVSQSGIYSVTVTNAAGCSSFDTIQLVFEGNTSALPNDSSICAGETILLEAGNPGATFSWSTGDTTASIAVGAAGWYSVESSFSACQFLDSILISVNALPNPDLGADTVLCAGEFIVLDASSGMVSYVWSDGSTGPNLLVDSTGTFTVIATDSTGCSGSDSIEVEFSIGAGAEVTGLHSDYCEADRAASLVAPEAGGNWGNTTPNGLFDPMVLGAGQFSVTYSWVDSVGCENVWEDSAAVWELPSVANAGPDQTLVGTMEAQMDANVPTIGSGTWTSPSSGLVLSNAQDAQATVVCGEPGPFQLIWTISNGTCPASSDEVGIMVEALTVPSGFSPNGDGRNENFVIRGIEAYPKRSLVIFNRWGNEVFSSEIYNNDWNGENNVDDTYFYVLDLGEGGEKSGYVVLKR